MTPVVNLYTGFNNDLMTLLFKTPIIEDITEEDLVKIEEYINKNTKDGNIKLIRRIYGFICENIK